MILSWTFLSVQIIDERILIEFAKLNAIIFNFLKVISNRRRRKNIFLHNDFVNPKMVCILLFLIQKLKSSYTEPISKYLYLN